MKNRGVVILFMAFLGTQLLSGQMDTAAILLLPKANAVQKDSYNRWGEGGNMVEVNFMFGKDGKIDFPLCLIEAEVKKKRVTYLLFPPGGSETDIFIYPIINYSQFNMDVNFDTLLKKNIFMYDAKTEDKLIRVDDIVPGFYFVQYTSCNYMGSYVLWIRASKEHNVN